MQILRIWSLSQHSHVQFNRLSKETLLAAQKNPNKYRNLVVRVASYSAFLRSPLSNSAGRDHRPHRGIIRYGVKLRRVG
jgi:pyruvate-formate lyase